MSLHITEDEFYWKCIEKVWDELSAIVDPEAYRAAFNTKAQWIRDLVSIHWLVEEFDNGGLMQFFLNDTGNLALDAAAAFRRIGIPEAGDAVADAISVFGSEYPLDEKLREKGLRVKTNIGPDQTTSELFKSGVFLPMEEALCQVGGEDLDFIYEKLNEYAMSASGEPSVAPNGGPAEPLGNSGVGGGPPSVS